MAFITWKSPVSGNWSDAADWSTGTVPTLADSVEIDASGSYTVTSSGVDTALALTINAPQAQLVENAGSLTVNGILTIDSGLVSLDGGNALGSIEVSGGELEFASEGSLGSGTVLVDGGGKLLATTNETLSNVLDLQGSPTIAAAHGTTLNEDATTSTADPNTTLDIGSAGEDGTILWHTNNQLGTFVAVNVDDGTLKAADGGLGDVLNSDQQTVVAVGATLDLGGFDASVANLTGGGAITNTGAAATLNLTGGTAGGNFSGAISGPLSVDFDTPESLSGLEDYTGSATLGPAATSVTNNGTYLLVANSNINGASTSTFTNDDLFEKTGGGGVSDVTTNFVNNGDLNVLSGSIEFSGGFTNNGVIHGLVTQNTIRPIGAPLTTTVSAPVPSDFSGDALSDILWQNVGGQASIWDMDGSVRLGGGPVSPNPGPSWTAVGSGDFNGDGHADILWQDTSTGQASIWEMDGGTRTGGGAVSPNPGPGWRVVGAGDFNRDGLSDILWQNTSTGQVSVWEMDGSIRTGGGALSVNPGPSWKAIGTGDFNGDGLSDILFQNTSTGQVSVWEMDGAARNGGGAVSVNPGPQWQAIGTGDFNDDGLADILFQNTSTGQVSIWEMDGANRIGGGSLSINPGPTWQAVGTGDFNGDGHSDILFQNTMTGQASVWEMDGTTRTGGGAVSVNPGTSWRAVGA